MTTPVTPVGIDGSSRKRSRMPPPTALGRISVARRFACLTNWWASCLILNQLFTSHQHGFLSNHSTATNLLEFTHDWVLSLQSHIYIDIIYIDFSRAFDSTVFSKLLHKLRIYSIDGKLHNWIRNFIAGRQQCVVNNYHFSVRFLAAFLRVLF